MRVKQIYGWNRNCVRCAAGLPPPEKLTLADVKCRSCIEHSKENKMQKSTIESKIKNELRDNFGYADIDTNAELKDIGMDSLDECQMIMFIEDEFSIVAHDSHAENWKTLSDVISYVKNKGG